MGSPSKPRYEVGKRTLWVERIGESYPSRANVFDRDCRGMTAEIDRMLTNPGRKLRGSKKRRNRLVGNPRKRGRRGWKEADWEIMEELSLGLTEPRRFSGGATKATP